MQRRRELQPSDADELEDHLRGSVDELVAVGLRADEAFLVAVKRMGSLDELSREFAREHSERLWKQLVLTGDAGDPAADTRSRRDLLAMVLCAAGAAVSVKVPALFGMSFDDDPGVLRAQLRPVRAALAGGLPRLAPPGQASRRRHTLQPTMYHGPVVDHAPVRRVRHGRGIERALSLPARTRGQTGLSVAFDLPTQMGYDANHPVGRGEVGTGGHADRVPGRHGRLLDGIRWSGVDVDDDQRHGVASCWRCISRSRKSAAYRSTTLEGTIQNDILKEYIARGTYIFPPRPSCALITDLFGIPRSEVPNWNTISISGYHMREAGASAVQELAFTLADGIEYVNGPASASGSTSTSSPAASLRSSSMSQQPAGGSRKVPGRPPAAGPDHPRGLGGSTRRGRGCCAFIRRPRAARSRPSSLTYNVVRTDRSGACGRAGRYTSLHTNCRG